MSKPRKSGKNQRFWAYNLPVQVRPRHQDEDDESTPVVGHDVELYMARKNRIGEPQDLADLLGDQTREEFFEDAARICENLARLLREVGTGKSDFIYYPDDGMDEPKRKTARTGSGPGERR